MASSTILSSTTLKKVIKVPHVVANTLDWKKASGGAATAIAIDVRPDKIGLALATIRSENDDETHWRRMNRQFRSRAVNCDQQNPLGYGYSFSCQPLDPIPLVPGNENSTGGRKRKKEVTLEAKRILSDLVQDHNVCSFVVSWPIQQDTGLLGASCGRTLWALEEFLKEEEADLSAGSLFAPNRPLCLWQRVPNSEVHTCADAFGRSSVYARTSTKTEHFASKEQYHLDDEPVLAMEVWRDFCEHHWPAAVTHNQDETSGAIPSDNVQSHGNNHAYAHPVESQYTGNCISSSTRALVAA